MPATYASLKHRDAARYELPSGHMIVRCGAPLPVVGGGDGYDGGGSAGDVAVASKPMCAFAPSSRFNRSTLNDVSGSTRRFTREPSPSCTSTSFLAVTACNVPIDQRSASRPVSLLAP